MAGMICQTILVNAKTFSWNPETKITSSNFDITVAQGENILDTEKQPPVAHAENIKGYPHSRIAFLKSSADLESRRSHRSGVTPPYCPSGPTLSRHYIFEDEAYGDRTELAAVGRRYERSLLSFDSLSRPSSPQHPSIKYTSWLAKKMPHALSMPQMGFQALILCGPGGSLNTFTTVPNEYPKALISLGNRPMVWYVLDWCYRMGVTSESRYSLLHFSEVSVLIVQGAAFWKHTFHPSRQHLLPQ
jgi:hypothetical protein